MSLDQFVVTPSSYTRQLEVDYRGRSGPVAFGDLEDARDRCTKWIAANRDNFSSTAKIL